MKVSINVYDKNKYFEGSKVIACFDLIGVASVEVKEIPLSDFLKESVVSCSDDYNKYTFLTFDNGDISRYRHCYVDVIRVD